MSLSELFTILNTIPVFKDKVAYRAFPVGHVPNLPYICYLATQTNNFKADNKVYKVIQGIDVELYTATKDESVETTLESAFDANNIVWQKYEDYIDDENVYMITYELEV